jgi:cell division protein FtsQ
VPAAAKLAARARAARSQRRRRRMRVVARVLLVLLPLLALAWLLLLSSWLTVDRVAVVGTERLTSQQVVDAAGTVRGTPLARVDTGAVAREVRGLAPVAEVEVQRDWPSTLRLVVTERTPVATVATPTGVRLLDDAGVPFAEEPVAPPGLPALEVARPGPEDLETRAALAVLLDLPEPLRAQVAVVRASSASGVTLGLGDGRTVVWGRPGDTATKAAALEALLRMPGAFFDVSAPGVVVRR